MVESDHYSHFQQNRAVCSRPENFLFFFFRPMRLLDLVV
jgi:hypothetical protein